MTPLQIAKEFCANFRGDGKGCLGAMIDDDGQIRRCCPKPRCLLSTLGERCAYFEECVATMGPRIEEPKFRAAFESAVRDYRLAAGLRCADERPCPICGRAMEPRERFCGICAAARRKQSTRQAVQRHRVRCKQLSPNEPLQIQGPEGVSNGGRYGDSGPHQKWLLTAYTDLVTDPLQQPSTINHQLPSCSIPAKSL